MKHEFETPIDTDSVTVELYVCASMYGTYEKQTDAIRRVKTLAEDGVIDELNRYTWARQLSPAAEDTWCEFARDKFEEFTEWAETSGRSLEPAFSRRTVNNEYMDECYEVIQFPIISIAVYSDDRLVRLAPTVDADGVAYRVADCLEELVEMAPRSSPPTTTLVEP